MEPYATDPNSGFSADPVTATSTWGSGKEVWCNMEGNYVHLVADMSHLPTWNVSLCALGVMGTEYTRSSHLSTVITVE